MGKRKTYFRPDPSTLANQTPMRYMERAFKSRIPPPPYDTVLDFTDEDERIDILPLNIVSDPRMYCQWFGDSNLEFKGYGVKGIEGLYFIPNIFSPRAQREMVKRCLDSYTKRPNVCNLDTHYLLPEDENEESGLWKMYSRAMKGQVDNVTVPLRGNSNYTINGYEVDAADHEVKHLEALPITDLIHRIRWYSLGYHYNWGTKTYHLDRPVLVPKEVKEISQAVAKSLEKPMGIQGDLYEPQAGIVNHYSYKDTLMAHQDRSELDETSPLVSISFGATAVFLMGHPTNDLSSPPPTPIYVRSGDILIMSGPCRRNFHGVPRIVEDTLPEYLSSNAVLDADEDEWKLFAGYMETGKRLNINVRQVFPRESI